VLPGARWTDAIEEGAIGGIPYRLEIRSWADSPRIDFRAQFEFDGQMIGGVSENRREARSPFVHEQKLRFRFYPTTGAGRTGVRDLPFIVAETPDPYIQGNHWTAVADGRSGIAVLNRGAMCSVREADGGLSIPLAYSMYYIWGTRILSGKYEYEFALYPFQGPWPDADLHRKALEYNFPFRLTAGEPGNGKLGRTMAAFDIESDGVILSALFSKAGTVHARWFEHRGKSGALRLNLLQGAGRLTETDLAGRHPTPFTGPLKFGPWQIKTIGIGA
jgi:hypothetical protein